MLSPALVWAGSSKSTTYYNVYYSQWQNVADAMSGYLDAAFTTARDVLGYDNSAYGKIDIYFFSDPNSSVTGFTVPGSNACYINISHGLSTDDSYLRSYGAAAAHETGHVLFFHETKLSMSSADASSYTWLTEALSYYIGDVAYPYGQKKSKDTLGAYLSYYSGNGSTKASWWSVGDSYRQGSVTSLGLAELQSIGLYLNDHGGWNAIHNLLNYLAQGYNVDGAFQMAYGKQTGQYGTTAGSGVNTIYSDYLYYYLGHY